MANNRGEQHYGQPRQRHEPPPPTTTTAAAPIPHQSDLARVSLADGQQHLVHHRDRLLARNPRALELRHEPKRVESPVALAGAVCLRGGCCELRVLILRGEPHAASRASKGGASNGIQGFED